MAIGSDRGRGVIPPRGGGGAPVFRDPADLDGDRHAARSDLDDLEPLGDRAVHLHLLTEIKKLQATVERVAARLEGIADTHHLWDGS